jgi:hypothetical protein
MWIQTMESAFINLDHVQCISFDVSEYDVASLEDIEVTAAMYKKDYTPDCEITTIITLGYFHSLFDLPNTLICKKMIRQAANDLLGSVMEAIGQGKGIICLGDIESIFMKKYSHKYKKTAEEAVGESLG